MKRDMTGHSFKIFRKVANRLFVLLGFSAFATVGVASCSVEYGSPSADYSVKGTVADGQGNPIKGIRVVSGFQLNDDFDGIDTTYTAADGTFELDYERSYVGGLHARFEDIDGADNGGEFKTKIITDLEYARTKKGDGDWYSGKYQADINVTLERESE